MARFLKTICQWLAGICAFFLVTMAIWNFANYCLSSRWVPVTAKINAIKITDASNNGESTNWSGLYKNFLCNYTYGFNGQIYSGNQGDIETFTTDSERHSEYRFLKDKMDGNTPVTIWVNPAVPAESVLFRGHDLAGNVFLLVIGVLLLGGILSNYKFRTKKAELGNEQK